MSYLMKNLSTSQDPYLDRAVIFIFVLYFEFPKQFNILHWFSILGSFVLLNLSQILLNGMDPVTALGLGVNIVTIIGTMLKTIEYLNGIKRAPEDWAKLSQECVGLLAVLTTLNHRQVDLESSQESCESLDLLEAENGPFRQLDSELSELMKKLKLFSEEKKLYRNVRWTLDKDKRASLLGRIERLKTLVGLVLQGQFMLVAQYNHQVLS